MVRDLRFKLYNLNYKITKMTLLPTDIIEIVLKLADLPTFLEFRRVNKKLYKYSGKIISDRIFEFTKIFQERTILQLIFINPKSYSRYELSHLVHAIKNVNILRLVVSRLRYQFIDFHILERLIDIDLNIYKKCIKNHQSLRRDDFYLYLFRNKKYDLIYKIRDEIPKGFWPDSVLTVPKLIPCYIKDSIRCNITAIICGTGIVGLFTYCGYKNFLLTSIAVCISGSIYVNIVSWMIR